MRSNNIFICKIEILFHFFPHSCAFILAFSISKSNDFRKQNRYCAFCGKLSFIAFCSVKGRLFSDFSTIHFKNFEIENRKQPYITIPAILIHTLKYPRVFRNVFYGIKTQCSFHIYFFLQAMLQQQRALGVFERKILRKIYGPVRENELRRMRRNDELEAIIKGENIVRFIKCQRIRWFSHIDRMQDTAVPKKLLYGKLNATRRRGRPKIRWLDDVSTDLRKMGINEWRDRARDREAWRRIVKGTKAHPGL